MQVWKASSGERLFTYRGHSGLVRALAWSPDGNYLASGDNDGTIQVIRSGKAIFTLRGHTGRVHTLGWSPDSKRIASGGEDRTIHLWDALSGSHAQNYRAHTHLVTCLAWSPDGQFFASGGEEKNVRVWDVTRLKTSLTPRDGLQATQKTNSSPVNVSIAPPNANKPQPSGQSPAPARIPAAPARSTVTKGTVLQASTRPQQQVSRRDVVTGLLGLVGLCSCVGWLAHSCSPSANSSTTASSTPTTPPSTLTPVSTTTPVSTPTSSPVGTTLYTYKSVSCKGVLGPDTGICCSPATWHRTCSTAPPEEF